jgi:hypothetical protein
LKKDLEEGKPPAIGTPYIKKWFAGNGSEIIITDKNKRS